MDKTTEEMQLVTDILEDDSSQVEELELVPESVNGSYEYQFTSHSYVYGHDHKSSADS